MGCYGVNRGAGNDGFDVGNSRGTVMNLASSCACVGEQKL